MATSDNSSAPLVASTSGATLPVTTLPVTTTQGNRAVRSFTPTMTIDVVDGGQDAGTSGASTQGNRAVSFAPTMTIDVDGRLDQTAPVPITRGPGPPRSGCARLCGDGQWQDQPRHRRRRRFPDQDGHADADPPRDRRRGCERHLHQAH